MIATMKTVRCAAASLTLAMLAAHAFAQYPERAVKIIVPFSAGGFTDSIARIVGQELSRKWGQPVIVENRLGAGGNIGAEIAAKSPADGYTLFLSTTPTHAVNPTLYRKIAFDPVKDFEPIVLMVTTPNLLVVNPAVPAGSLREFVALAKADPKRFDYGSTGTGSSGNLQGELFKSTAGIQMTHIPYKGSPQALPDLLAGSVQVMFDNYMFQLPYVRAGKVRALAITATKRAAALGEVPTMQEAGVAGFETGPWFGLSAPAKTPSAVISRVNADVNAVLQSKEVQDKLAGAEFLGGTPQQYGDFINKELAKWGSVIRALNLAAD